MSDAIVKVRGLGVVPAEPDEAEVTLRITRLEQDADVAFQHVARQNEELHRIFEDLAIEPRMLSTGGLSVREEREWEDGAYHHRGYRATKSIRVRLEDPQKVARLVQQSSSRALAQVEDPRWRIALENPARVEACRRAAAEAKRKAEAYASALGGRLGAVVSVREPGLDDHGGRRAMLTAAEMSLQSPEEMTIETGELDISAVVDVIFRLERD